MTDTRHAPACSRPGWHTERSHALAAVVVARCKSCGAVEMRTPDTEKEKP